MLTEENIYDFEREKSRLEKLAKEKFLEYSRAQDAVITLHNNFRSQHNLTGSTFQSIADWRWNKAHPTGCQCELHPKRGLQI